MECVDDLGKQEEEMLPGNNQIRQAGATSGLGVKEIFFRKDPSEWVKQLKLEVGSLYLQIWNIILM